MTPATRHLYDPRVGSSVAEDLCDDHAAEALAEDEAGHVEVTPAPAGTPCGRCAEGEAPTASRR